MGRYICAIDQGTTQTTVLILSESIDIVGKHSSEFDQIYPHPGWVEHNPEQIWSSVVKGLRAAIEDAGIRADEIAAIGITNQRETTVLWEKATGRPVHNAIVWQCRRTEPMCEELRAQGFESEFQDKTGLVLDPYFSCTKLSWLLDNVDGAAARARRGELAFGTIDSYLVWKLTGGRSHVTDPSNASRTGLYDIRTRRFDEDLLEKFAVPPSLLPRVEPSSAVVGHTAGVPGLPDEIPIAGIAGDQQAALFGQLCFEPGSAKCTYGTGAFLMLNTGEQLVRSQHGLLTTVAWQVGSEFSYAIEGSVFVAGAAVGWLRDGLGILSSAAQVEELARQVKDSGGVIFVPALAGLGAPHWKSDVRGVIRGITRSTTRAHLARACLDGIALQVADLIASMDSAAPRPIHELRVDGGAAANNLLMQIQADLLARPLVRPVALESTGIGAALLAGLAVGVWRDREDVKKNWSEDRRFVPNEETEELAALKKAWSEALTCL